MTQDFVYLHVASAMDLYTIPRLSSPLSSNRQNPTDMACVISQEAPFHLLLEISLGSGGISTARASKHLAHAVVNKGSWFGNTGSVPSFQNHMY